MSTHNICFYGEMTKIIFHLSSDTRLICSLGFYVLYTSSISFQTTLVLHVKLKSTGVTQIPVRTQLVAMMTGPSLGVHVPVVTMVTGVRRVTTSVRAWIPVRMEVVVWIQGTNQSVSVQQLMLENTVKKVGWFVPNAPILTLFLPSGLCYSY